jgi:hypothetical protein
MLEPSVYLRRLDVAVFKRLSSSAISLKSLYIKQSRHFSQNCDMSIDSQVICRKVKFANYLSFLYDAFFRKLIVVLSSYLSRKVIYFYYSL